MARRSSQTIVLTGNEALNRKLQAVAGAKAKAIIRKAAREALRPAFQAARASAPRRTGKLARSVKLRAITRSRSRVGARITTSATDNQFSGKTYYGGFQEFGWKAGKRTSNAMLGVGKNKKRTTDQKAEAQRRNAARREVPGKHWLKKTADSHQQSTLVRYSDAIETGLVKLAQGTT